MARRVFFSFHYERDGWRAAQVRNMGRLEADNPVSDNEWEQVKRGGDAAVQRWIDAQMNGKTCCIVLVGQETASRKWVRYEIERAWRLRKGVVGIRVHRLLDRNGHSSQPGPSPFEMNVDGTRLSSAVSLYDPFGLDSKGVYATIRDNIEGWVEEAIARRTRY